MRLKIRADSVRECRRQWLRNERGRPLSSDLGLLQCFSVGSRLSPQFPGQVHDVPTLQTFRISAQQIACGLLSPAGFLPAPLLVVVPCRLSTWTTQISSTFRAFILNLSTVRKTESHI